MYSSLKKNIQKKKMKRFIRSGTHSHEHNILHFTPSKKAPFLLILKPSARYNEFYIPKEKLKINLSLLSIIKGQMKNTKML